MVRMLNEESWDDVVRNYPDSSSTTRLKYFYLALKNVCLFIHSFYSYVNYFYFITYTYICLFH